MTIATAPEPPRWFPVSASTARVAAYIVATAGLLTLLLGFRVYSSTDEVAWIMPMLAFILVGTVILHRWPTHPIGWLFLWLGALAGLSSGMGALVLPDALAIGDLPVAADKVPAHVTVVTLAAEALNTATIVALVPLTLLLFPDGRLPSRRWRWVPILAVVGAALGAVATVLNGGWGGDTAQAIVVSPYAGTTVANVTTTLLYPLLMFAWVASAVAMVMRYRRTTGLERTQLKLLAAAAIYAALAIIVTLIAAGGEAAGMYVWPIAIAMAAPPVAAGIAILRYRLFDIDVVIRRSLIVGGLVLFVIGFYVVVVVGAGRLLGTHGGTNPILAVTATAAVAFAFQPVQQRLTRWANRVVYGRRTTPYEVLTTFAREVAGTADPDALLTRAAASLADGTGAVTATVWMRVGDRLHPAAHHPAGEPPPDHALPGDGTLPDLPGNIGVQVRHGGELLGAVTLTKPRGEPPTPADTALAQRLADQIGVALTNLRLTAELHRRAAELAASRRRVLTAADDERRTVERRLSERAGQRLIALKTGLAVAQRTAESAPRTCEQLATVRSILDDGIEELHRLTRGLYPPLLEDEGLAVALRSAADRTALDVHIDIDGVERLPVAHERAIYFCILEALANVAKHADTSSVRVTLRRDGGVVSFTVVDAGRGFDSSDMGQGAGMANIRDRISALDGTLVVRSTPGGGTTVNATLPVPAGAAVAP